jgi:hypothetical protein
MRWLAAVAVCAIGCGDSQQTTQDAATDASSDAGVCSAGLPVVVPATTAACTEIAYPGLPSLEAGGIVRAVVATDLDADGDVDIAVAVSATSAHRFVRMFRGDGTGRFTLAGTTDVAVSTSLLAADVNGDTHVDLIAGVQLLAGHGDGTFAAPVELDADPANAPAVIADVDGDTKPDLLLASPPRVRRGVGDGTFAAAVAIPDAGAAVVRAVKLDADADLDLVFANGATELGNGDGTFAAAVTHDFGGATSSVIATDVDGDMKIDLVGLAAAT